MDKLIVSPSPHIHTKTTTRVLMRDVVIALLPAAIVSVVFYGWDALLVLGVSVVSCVLLEYLITRYLLKRPSTVGDLSAVVTGMLLALNLPTATPWWVVFIGALVAIGIAKMTFGGLGQNVFNPALVGRVFLLVSFPTYMTHWEIPKGLFGVDAVTGATPLGVIKEGLMQGSTIPDLMAQHGTPIPDAFGQPRRLGRQRTRSRSWRFVYLLIRKSSSPGSPCRFWAPWPPLASSGWRIPPDSPIRLQPADRRYTLGSCFMATDYVNLSMNTKGGILFGVIVTMMIRYFGSYPDGISFAILIMNATVPLLNIWFHQKKIREA